MNTINEYETQIKHGKAILKIHQDTDPMNPRTEWDNLGSMICLHSRYNLGDKHSFRDSEDIHEHIKENNIKSVLPLYLYDHSGITINTTGFYCPWDSGQVGFIWIEDDKIRSEYGVKRISRKLRLRMLEYLKAEVETYDDYLTGNVYGFTYHEEIRINPNGDTKDINEDSCWGFYGDNHLTCILEHLPITTKPEDWL